jgi:hypothetical protein
VALVTNQPVAPEILKAVRRASTAILPVPKRDGLAPVTWTVGLCCQLSG